MRLNFRNKFKYQIIGLVALMSVTLSLAGFFYYQHEERLTQEEKYNELRAIGKLKANQLTQWHKERMSEASFFSKDSPSAQYAINLIKGKSKEDSLLRSSLSRIMTNKRYENIYLLDGDGRRIFSVLPESDPVDSEIVKLSAKAIREQKIEFSDFFFCGIHNKVHLEIIAPVLNEKEKVLGTLNFRIDPSDYLYPLIQDWPIPSKTAETVIVRREKDSIRFLNKLEHQANDSLQTVFPISRTNMPAVQAALGKTGLFQGHDYIGHQVLCDLNKVAETPWYMIVKVETGELYNELNKQAILVAIIIFMTIFFVTATVAWIYFNRQRNILRELLHRKSELHQSQEEFGATLYSMGDGVITTDLIGRIKQMNPVAERLTDWKEASAKGKKIDEIFIIKHEETLERVENPIDKILREGQRVSLTNQGILISAKNSETPIDVNGSPIRDKNGKMLGVVIVFSDKTAERSRRKLLDIRLNLLEYAPHHNLEDTLKTTLDKIGHYSDSPIAFFHIVKPGEDSLWLKTWSSRVEENADTEDSKTSNGQFREADVWTECIQLRKAVIHNDFNFLKKAERPEGIYRTMVVPVFRNQQVVAVLGLINKKTDYLETDVEIVNYLADVTWEVSEIKIKEDSLRESEETIRLLFNSTAEGIYGVDTFGNCTFINKATLTLLGYTDEQELIGKNMHRMIHHSHQDGSIYHTKDCRIYNAFQKGVGSHVDDEVLWRKNGSSFPSEYWSYPIQRDGKIIGSVVTFLDITQRKHDEAVQQILYDVARTSMSTGTQESLLKTVRDEINKVMDASDFYVAYYHPETDTLRSLQTTDQTSEWKEWKTENSLSGQVVRTGQPLLLNKEEMIEYLSSHHLTEEMPAESWLGVPILEGQNPIGVMVVQSLTNPKAYTASNARLLDIIAHELSTAIQRNKMIQDLIQAKEKAEESDHLKTAFLANMSHEIRTPMNGILGFLSLLNEPDLEEKKRQDFIDIVNKSSQRLLDTINDIIEISQIEAGEIEVNPSVVDLEEVMQFYYDFFKIQTESKGIDFTFTEGLKGAAALIRADRQKLDSILTNLIRNAIKFTSKGRIEVGNYLEGDTLYFYVKDTGRGIPKDRLEAIFERFVQADLKLTRDHEGSGLGLAIVKAYVQAMGGNIWVESDPNEGSKFFFTLPYQAAEQKMETSKNTPWKPENQSRKGTILIAEDDESSYYLLEIALSEEGYQLIHTLNGEDTVKTVRENIDISLIIMDIKMPGMDGLEATTRIRQFNKHVPIIAQTAYAFSSDRTKALESGCNDFITKPIKSSDLIGLVNKYTNIPEA